MTFLEWLFGQIKPVKPVLLNHACPGYFMYDDGSWIGPVTLKSMDVANEIRLIYEIRVQRPGTITKMAIHWLGVRREKALEPGPVAVDKGNLLELTYHVTGTFNE